MENLKVIHENCNGVLEHAFSTLHHDYFECSKCGVFVNYEKDPEPNIDYNQAEAAQMLFLS